MKIVLIFLLAAVTLVAAQASIIEPFLRPLADLVRVILEGPFFGPIFMMLGIDGLVSNLLDNFENFVNDL